MVRLVIGLNRMVCGFSTASFPMSEEGVLVSFLPHPRSARMVHAEGIPMQKLVDDRRLTSDACYMHVVKVIINLYL